MKFLLNRKNVLLGSFLMAASTVASAAYYETVASSSMLLGSVTAIGTLISSSPVGTHAVTNTYNDDAYLRTTTNVTFSSSPMPYVRSEVLHELRNGGIGLSYAAGSIAYDFYVTGTPNTEVPVTIASAFSFSGYSYNENGVVYPLDNMNGNADSGVFLRYGAGLLPSLGTDGLLPSLGANGAASMISVNTANIDVDYPIGYAAINAESDTYSVTSDLVLNYGSMEVAPGRVLNGGSYFSNGLIIATLMLMLDDNGVATGHVAIEANNSVYIPSDGGGVSFASAYIDPYISIAPSYLRDHPNAVISLDTNVGNAPIATAAVPLPAAAWLFGSAVLGLLGLNRRRSV